VLPAPAPVSAALPLDPGDWLILADVSCDTAMRVPPDPPPRLPTRPNA
jgi:hypothetical protein